MKKICILIVTILLALSSKAQELKFKEELKVSIAKNANSQFPVIYSNKYLNEKTDIRFDLNLDTLSFGLKKNIDWSEKKIFDLETAEANKISNSSFKAQIFPEGKYLKINIFPFKIPEDLQEPRKENLEKANSFIKNHEFAIELPERTNLSFPYKRFHAGVLTIPVKIYLDSQTGELKNNAESDINIGIYGGILLGRKHFAKIPSEKEYRVYEKGWSINGFVSFNKQEVDKSNRVESSTFEGNFATISSGINFAIHYKSFASFIAFGWDTPLNRFGSEWNFKNKPWIGIGIGIDLFE